MSSNADGSVPATQNPTAVHLPSLAAALFIMLGGTIYPLVFASADGTPDHAFAMAIFWSMSAGLVRGVGFVPVALAWRIVFSGWACLAGLLAAMGLRFWT